jgi:hypothetical protein
VSHDGTDKDKICCSINQTDAEGFYYKPAGPEQCCIIMKSTTTIAPPTDTGTFILLQKASEQEQLQNLKK